MKQWDVNWGLFRKKIVFADGPETLAQGVQDLLLMAESCCIQPEGLRP